MFRWTIFLKKIQYLLVGLEIFFYVNLLLTRFAVVFQWAQGVCEGAGLGSQVHPPCQAKGGKCLVLKNI